METMNEAMKTINENVEQLIGLFLECDDTWDDDELFEYIENEVNSIVYRVVDDNETIEEIENEQVVYECNPHSDEIRRCLIEIAKTFIEHFDYESHPFCIGY